MNTTIYYFSATGNSLHLARSIAGKLDNCELVPIARAIKMDNVETPSERIGLVFPVYAWGMPRIVSDFVSKLLINQHQYIFAVATCAAIPGNTLKELQKAFHHKGTELNAGFAVSAHGSSLMSSKQLIKIINRIESRREKIKNSDTRLEEIVTTVKNLKRHRIETSSWCVNMFSSIFHNLALKSFKEIDTAFDIKDSCSGCGICARVCPRANIIMKDGHPVFNHNCELCHGCLQWCPEFAIKHPGFDTSLRQYHNPMVQLIDLVANND